LSISPSHLAYLTKRLQI